MASLIPHLDWYRKRFLRSVHFSSSNFIIHNDKNIPRYSIAHPWYPRTHCSTLQNAQLRRIKSWFLGAAWMRENLKTTVQCMHNIEWLSQCPSIAHSSWDINTGSLRGHRPIQALHMYGWVPLKITKHNRSNLGRPLSYISKPSKPISYTTVQAALCLEVCEVETLKST
jgi:hypothetical protein